MRKFSPKFEQSLKEKNYWVKKTHSKSKHDLVIVSDSRGLRGINPKYLTRYSDPLNFSYRSAGLSIFYIKAALKRLKKSGTLLIALTPISLVDKHMSNDHFYEYYSMSFDEVWVASNYKLLKAFSPLRLGKFELQKESFFSKKFYENGFVATIPKRFEIKKGLITYKEQFEKKKINLENLRTVLKYLKDENVNVIAFRMVSCKKMEKLENSLGMFDEEKVQGLFNMYGMRWISFEHRFKYETYDASHLTPTSAKNFSKDLQSLL